MLGFVVPEFEALCSKIWANRFAGADQSNRGLSGISSSEFGAGLLLMALSSAARLAGCDGGSSAPPGRALGWIFGGLTLPSDWIDNAKI